MRDILDIMAFVSHITAVAIVVEAISGDGNMDASMAVFFMLQAICLKMRGSK